MKGAVPEFAAHYGAHVRVSSLLQIDDFQNKPTDRPCVFIVTYATAAVGITLTAATRVYLMEPSVDPAAELQAAGRIHRLGQTKEIHIKRFAFKDSIDEAIVGLHDKITSGDITIVDKEFPPTVLQHFMDAGVARPHVIPPSALPGKLVAGRFRKQDTPYHLSKGHSDGRQFISWGGGGESPDDYGYTYRQAPCSCCGRTQSVDGSVEWWGVGNMRWLIGQKGCMRTFDYPLRPKDEEEARALLGNDPARAAEADAIVASSTKIQLHCVKKALKEAEEVHTRAVSVKLQDWEVRMLKSKVDELKAEVAKLEGGGKSAVRPWESSRAWESAVPPAALPPPRPFAFLSSSWVPRPSGSAGSAASAAASAASASKMAADVKKAVATLRESGYTYKPPDPNPSRPFGQPPMASSSSAAAWPGVRPTDMKPSVPAPDLDSLPLLPASGLKPTKEAWKETWHEFKKVAKRELGNGVDYERLKQASREPIVAVWAADPSRAMAAIERLWSVVARDTRPAGGVRSAVLALLPSRRRHLWQSLLDERSSM